MIKQPSFLQVALQAAEAAGKTLKKFWGNVQHIQEKSFAGDLVTEADGHSEKAIIEILQKAYPTHSILSEEAGELLQESPYLWVIDPLDGTTNYTHGYPMVSISIALLYQNAPITAVVFNPILDELFTSEKGQGAFFNQRQLHVSKNATLTKSLLATGFAYDRNKTKDNNYKEFCHITSLSQGVRRLGSAALDLSYVAAGRLDGFWERGLKPWDMAAGILLITEAGGLVTSYEGTPYDLQSGRILATNGLIHDELKCALASAQNTK